MICPLTAFLVEAAIDIPSISWLDRPNEGSCLAMAEERDIIANREEAVSTWLRRLTLSHNKGNFIALGESVSPTFFFNTIFKVLSIEGRAIDVKAES